MSGLKSFVPIAALLAALTALGCAPAPVVGRPATAASAAPSAPADQGGRRSLVFVLTTGLEDMQMMTSAFRHARVAMEQKKLDEVTVLIYGRGVHAVDGAISARPPQLSALIRDAMTAGVHVQVCAHALANMGIGPEKLDPPGVEIVPNAMITLVDDVARGAAIVRY